MKDEIRKILPHCLRDPQSKVRSTVAYAISAIASLDWPEQWGCLFDELMAALSSGESDLVHGAMRVLSGTYDGHCLIAECYCRVCTSVQSLL